jgi:hypothetical protein
VTRPIMQMNLNHPVELDGVTYEKLAITHLEALASFRANSPEQVIRSMALVFAVPRRVVRHLDNSDAEQAGELLVNFLDAAARASLPLEI